MHGRSDKTEPLYNWLNRLPKAEALMSHAGTVKRIFAIEGLNAQEKTPTATSRPRSISTTLRELAAQGGIYVLYIAGIVHQVVL